MSYINKVCMKKAGIVWDYHDQQYPTIDHAKWCGNRKNGIFHSKVFFFFVSLNSFWILATTWTSAWSFLGKISKVACHCLLPNAKRGTAPRSPNCKAFLAKGRTKIYGVLVSILVPRLNKTGFLITYYYIPPSAWQCFLIKVKLVPEEQEKNSWERGNHRSCNFQKDIKAI